MGDESPVRGVSIGFLRTNWGQPTKDDIAKYGPHLMTTRAWKWMELSVTPQPCNPEAWIVGAGKSAPKLDDRTAGTIDNLARKGVIRPATARALGLETSPARKKLLIF